MVLAPSPYRAVGLDCHTMGPPGGDRYDIRQPFHWNRRVAIGGGSISQSFAGSPGDHCVVLKQGDAETISRAHHNRILQSLNLHWGGNRGGVAVAQSTV